MKKRLTMTEFVIICKKSGTIAEVIKESRLSKQSVFARLANCRKHIKNFKKFPRSTGTNWEEVQKAYDNA